MECLKTVLRKKCGFINAPAAIHHFCTILFAWNDAHSMSPRAMDSVLNFQFIISLFAHPTQKERFVLVVWWKRKREWVWKWTTDKRQLHANVRCDVMWHSSSSALLLLLNECFHISLNVIIQHISRHFNHRFIPIILIAKSSIPMGVALLLRSTWNEPKFGDSNVYALHSFVDYNQNSKS